MTHTEAKKLIDALHDIACRDKNTGITARLLDEAELALEKQIPESLFHQKEYFDEEEDELIEEELRCQHCDSDLLGFLNHYDDIKYCPLCGQRMSF